MFEKKDIKDENDIITAEGAARHEEEGAGQAAERLRHQRRLLSGLRSRAEEPARSSATTSGPTCSSAISQDGFDPAQAADRIKPGLLAFRGWGLERQLSADRRALHRRPARRTSRRCARRSRRSTRSCTASRDVEKPVNLKVSKRGSPYNLGDEVPRHFLSVLSDGRAGAVHERQRPPRARRRHPRASRSRCASSSIASGRGTSAPASSIRRATSASPASGRPTPSCSNTWRSRSSTHGLSIKKLHREIMLSAVYQLSTRAHARRTSTRTPATGCYWRANRHRMTAEQVRDSLLFVSGALDTKMGGPSTPLTPSFDRRTVYGKVSRYKLDDFLQLFDFPSPNLSAREALHDQRAAAAAVLHEQRFHAAAGRAARAPDREPSRTTRPGFRRPTV